MGYGWRGCISAPPPVASSDFDRDYGMPLELCHESAPGSGLFTRRWSKAVIAFDCNAFEANITVLSQHHR